jgi:hypothetical protein
MWQATIPPQALMQQALASTVLFDWGQGSPQLLTLRASKSSTDGRLLFRDDATCCLKVFVAFSKEMEKASARAP